MRMISFCQFSLYFIQCTWHSAYFVQKNRHVLLPIGSLLLQKSTYCLLDKWNHSTCYVNSKLLKIHEKYQALPTWVSNEQKQQQLNLLFVCNYHCDGKSKQILYLWLIALITSCQLVHRRLNISSCCPGTPFGSCTHIYSNAEHLLPGTPMPTCPLTYSTCTIVLHTTLMPLVYITCN